MFLEVCVALLILAAAMVAIAQLLVLAAQQRRAVDRQRVATREVANLMEQAMALPWEQLSEEGLRDLQLSEVSQLRLPEARANLQVMVEEGPPLGKRVTVQVDWRNRAGLRPQPVELSAWRFRPNEEAAP
jgi:hypothetical protein